MIRLGAEASRQLADLLQHYWDLDRPEAARNLRDAIDQAAEQIERDPTAGLLSPRPYPDLARPSVSWIKIYRYWIAFARAASAPDFRRRTAGRATAVAAVTGEAIRSQPPPALRSPHDPPF